MKFKLINTIDVTEKQVLDLIKATNGEHFICGWKGFGPKFKANTSLIFEVICDNKPNSETGIVWELKEL